MKVSKKLHFSFSLCRHHQHRPVTARDSLKAGRPQADVGGAGKVKKQNAIVLKLSGNDLVSL